MKQNINKLVFASNNPNKIAEIQQLVGTKFEIVSLEDIGCFEEIPETASTIEGNAALKANYITQNYGLPCFADDTGLEVVALNGAPGVYSARYAGLEKNAYQNMKLLLENLKNETNKSAQFKTVIVLNINAQQYLFEGIIKGQIIEKKTGSQGFGYDPIFVPENETRTFAQMSMQEKALMSHRGRAIEKMIDFLKKHKNTND